MAQLGPPTVQRWDGGANSDGGPIIQGTITATTVNIGRSLFTFRQHADSSLITIRLQEATVKFQKPTRSQSGSLPGTLRPSKDSFLVPVLLMLTSGIYILKYSKYGSNAVDHGIFDALASKGRAK